MMKIFNWLAGAALAASLAACGGGGGSAGTVDTGGGGGGGTVTLPPTISLDIVDSTGAVTTTVGSTSTVFARATVKDSAGGGLNGVVVSFNTDSALARFVPAAGTGLTGSNGIATVQITPATATSAGAGTLTASATVGTTALTKSTTYSVPSGTSVDTQTAKVSTYIMLLDKSTLPNAGTATAKLTVVALDANNNIVPDAVVQVTTDANTFFTPNSTKTDSSGIFTGTITNGGDKTDRPVTITATVNNITKSTSLAITGSQLTMTATPSVLTPGAPATVTVRLTDSSNLPIAGVPLLIDGDFTSINGPRTTDVNGNVILNVTAPATAGSKIVSAAGSGISKQLSIQVGSSVSIPVAVIPGGVQPSLAAVPNVVAVNTAGSTANQSQLRFQFVDQANTPVPNVRVRFDITSTGQGSFDSTISTGAATVFTNAAGIATASFIPGQTGSPTDGVQVRACWQATDFTLPNQCANFVQANLTVVAQALAVSIGDDNLLESKSGTYVKKFVVTVADAAGRPVPNASVDLNLDLTHYSKGAFASPYLDASGSPIIGGSGLTVVPTDSNYFNEGYGALVAGGALFTAAPQPTLLPDPSGPAQRVWCPNEDRNRNGIADPGENIDGSLDSFGQPTLQPRRSDMLISYVDPTVTTTDAHGILLIQVQYAQRFGTWLAYRVRATTSVAGSQGSAERLFVTDVAEADKINGAFLVPPYGTHACNVAN